MHTIKRVLIALMAVMLAGAILPLTFPPPSSGYNRSHRVDTADSIVDKNGGGDYRTIQAAIDNASSGDVIHVKEGTYRENIVIHTPLTLIGSENDKIVIDGGGAGDVIRVTADNVNIRGFSVMGSGLEEMDSGLVMEGSENCVENCSFVNNRNGILLRDSHENHIANNTCFSMNGDGIRLLDSSDNEISNNDITARNYTVEERTSVLYDAPLGGTPADQEFMYMTYPFSSSATQTYENNMTVLDTTAVKNDKAGYFNDPDSMPEFNLTRGFSVFFTLHIMNETHAGTDRDGDGVDDRAGFNVIVISSDLTGVELAFWEDELWVQEDGGDMPPNGDLFTHAEGVSFDTTSGMIDYCLKFQHDNYTLTANDTPILTGKVRDYTAFSGLMDPYETANLFFIGDDTSSASAKAGISHASVAVNVTVPNPDPDPNYDHGLYLHSSDNNIIWNNTIHNSSGAGIHLHDSSDNLFHLNVLDNNTGAGIKITDMDSSGNTVYHNTFSDNNARGIQGFDSGSGNIWDDGVHGNYWSDHESRFPDSANDGTVWNTPYGMEGTAGSADGYPLVRSGEPEVMDVTPPAITADNSSTSGTTGDPFEFNISAWDDTGVHSVKVNWRHGVLEGNTSLSGHHNYWSGNITLDNSVHDLSYVVHINDTEGNLYHSEPKLIEVTDNDPPTFIDHSPDNGTTGDLFEFNIYAWDNIGVETIVVNWSHGERTKDVVLNEKDGCWVGSMELANDTGNLTYRIHVIDSSGNIINGTTHDKPVLDNDAPVAVAGPDQVAYLYENIILSGENSSDNIGIVNFTWSLLTNEGPLYLHGSILDISFNYFGFFPITLSVTDSAGNHGEDVINITVLPPGGCVDDDEYDNASTDDNGTDDDTTGDDEKTEDDDSDDDTETGDPIQTGKGDENFFASKEGISIIVGAFLLIIIMIVFVLRKRDTREKIDAPGSDGETGDNLPGVDGEISEDSEIKSEENGNNE